MRPERTAVPASGSLWAQENIPLFPVPQWGQHRAWSLPVGAGGTDWLCGMHGKQPCLEQLGHAGRGGRVVNGDGRLMRLGERAARATPHGGVGQALRKARLRGGPASQRDTSRQKRRRAGSGTRDAERSRRLAQTGVRGARSADGRTDLVWSMLRRSARVSSSGAPKSPEPPLDRAPPP